VVYSSGSAPTAVGRIADEVFIRAQHAWPNFS